MSLKKRLFVPALLLWLSSAVLAAATVGEPAPTFSAADTSGKRISLADFKGKTVVLEWVNPGCPFVQKHYRSANMQATQKAAVSQGVVWLSVNSTAVGDTDYKAPAEMGAWMQQQRGTPSATLMDSDGRIGRAYGARTTPHMFVIDGNGRLVYAGAIDSKPSGKVADIDTATNYVKQAVKELAAGRSVSTPATAPYGCSVHYGAPA
jgi:peroxiredoxin